MSRFIIDSGAFLALLDARDKYHSAAQVFTEANEDATFIIPGTIFAETLTLVKGRLGAKPAILLGERILRSPRFQLVHLSDNDHQATWDIFKQYDDKSWSYADCSLLAMARRLQITSIFSFDHHISQMAELKRVP